MTDHAIEHRLDTEAKAARALIEALRAADMGDDEALAVDTIEGETSLLEALDAADAEIRDCEVTVEGCKAVEATLKVRRDRAAARIEKIRAAVEQAMVMGNLKTVKRPTATFSLAQRKPGLVIDDESQIPAAYFVPRPPQIDRAALRRAIEEAPIPGCHLDNGSINITIRRR